MRPVPVRSAVALVMTAGLLTACGRLPHRDSDCPGGEVASVSRGPVPAAPAPTESLWEVDVAGKLRAVRPGGVVDTADVARIDPPLPPVLVAGGGVLWLYRLDIGEVALIDPARAAVIRHVAVPAVRPYVDNHAVYAHRALWIAQPGRLWRIGATGPATSSALPAGFRPSQLVATTRRLWLSAGHRLLRVDPADPAHPTETALDFGVGQLLPANELYATGINSPVVHRLDPDTGTVAGTVRLAHDELASAMVGAGAQVWAVGNCGNLVRLQDRHVVRVSDVSQDLPAVAALGSLWVGDEVRSEIVRLDAATGHVLARIPFAAADPADPAFALLAGENTVWVLDGGVSRVDPATDRVTRIVPATPGPGVLSAVVAQNVG
jgi:hypothetical protein